MTQHFKCFIEDISSENVFCFKKIHYAAAQKDLRNLLDSNIREICVFFGAVVRIWSPIVHHHRVLQNPFTILFVVNCIDGSLLCIHDDLFHRVVPAGEDDVACLQVTDSQCLDALNLILKT